MTVTDALKIADDPNYEETYTLIKALIIIADEYRKVKTELDYHEWKDDRPIVGDWD